MTLYIRHLLPLLALCVSSALVGEEKVDLTKPLVLANSHVQLEFEAGNMGLSAMIDRASGVNHLSPAGGAGLPGARRLLWEIAMARGVEQVPRINNNYRPCSYATRETAADGVQRVVMQWNGLRWWLEDDVISVQVTVELPPDSGIARWRIRVDTNSTYWGLWTVVFPYVNGFPGRGAYDIARPVFAGGGELMPKWSAAVRGQHPSGFWPMQFMAFSRGKNSVYFGSRDPDGRPKDFVALPGESLSMVHYPENMSVPGSDYADFYPIEMGVYQGNWVEAARHYRHWALNQKWVQRGRVSGRKDIPDSLKKVAVWVTEGWDWFPKPGAPATGSGYITASGANEQPTDSNQVYLEAQKRLGVPMGMHWYHWHHNKFNHEFPYFMPARPGFKERTAELVKAGWLVMPYINGYSADLNLPDFSKFAPSAQTDIAGGYRMGNYGDSAGRLLGMCPTDLWRDEIANVSESIFREYGVNGLYIDQVSAVSPGLCFNRSHGHPLGGGRYFTDGYRELLDATARKAQRNGKQLAITSEGANEMFFDVLAGNLFWAQPDDRDIPMMQVVYSGYTLFFGSPANYHKSERFFRFSQGRALMDGRQNGWMDVGLFREGNERKVNFLGECGRYHQAAAKFLVFGELLEPIEPTNAIPTFEDEFGWASKHNGKAPLAEGRLWRAEDGTLGVILANYDDESVSFEYSIDPEKFGIKTARYEIWESGPQGRTRLDTVSGVLTRRENLRPAGIRMIEIVPVAESAGR